MPTTAISISSVVTPIITSATTWANLKGASVQDPVYLAAFNESAIAVRVTGNSTATTVNTGMPIVSSGTLSRTFTRKSIGLFAFTTGSTATLLVETDR